MNKYFTRINNFYRKIKSLWINAEITVGKLQTIIDDFDRLDHKISDIRRSEEVTQSKFIQIESKLEEALKIARSTEFFTKRNWAYQCKRLVDMVNVEIINLPQDNPYPVFNPAMTIENQDVILIARMSNLLCVADKHYSLKDGQHNTKNFMFRFNNEWELSNTNLVNDDEIRVSVLEKYPGCSYHGIEDLRLFNGLKATHGIGAAVIFDSIGIRTIQVLFTLNLQNKALIKPIIPISPKNARFEKNWIPFFQDGKTYLIYSIDPFVIYELIDDKLIPSMQTGEIGEDHEAIRIQGGSNLISIENNFIGIAHDYKCIADKIYYTHRFYKLNANRELIELGDSFNVESRGIEFVTGLAKHQDKIYISYGLSDRSAKLIKMNLADLHHFIN